VSLDNAIKAACDPMTVCCMAWEANLSDAEMEAVKRGEEVERVSRRPDRREIMTVWCVSTDGESATLKAPVRRAKGNALGIIFRGQRGAVEVEPFVREESPDEGLIPDTMLAALGANQA